jgi:N-acetylglucosaminyl-diphospho-decaprenol L-rhamnosyltransferase
LAIQNSKGVDVSAIIISLNSMHFLGDCIQSLYAAQWRDYSFEIIVVDNGSTDGSLEFLAARHPEITVVANGSNLGYCKAGNQGAEVSNGRYFLFLNDDILIVGDAIARLVEFMEAHPNAGMIGSRLLNADLTDQYSSGRSFTTPAAALFGRKSMLTRLFPNAYWARAYLLSDRMNETEPFEVDWLSAAAMMASRVAFEESGKLEESFYYFHEQIICARMKKSGYGIFLDPQSKIIHFEGVGSGVRTKRIRRKHIERFHQAAYRWYCLHSEIGRWNPIRIPIIFLLTIRAFSLIALESIKPEPKRIETESRAGRPEGGVPI